MQLSSSQTHPTFQKVPRPEREAQESKDEAKTQYQVHHVLVNYIIHSVVETEKQKQLAFFPDVEELIRKSKFTYLGLRLMNNAYLFEECRETLSLPISGLASSFSAASRTFRKSFSHVSDTGSL
jgi:hypothetical protein